MKNLLITAVILAFVGFSYGQTPCGELPVVNPDTKASVENAQTYFQNNLPSSIGEDETTHGVFKVLVDCEGAVDTVFYTNGAMSDQQAEDVIGVVQNMEFTAAQKDGEAVKTYAFISLKISSGQASCAIN